MPVLDAKALDIDPEGMAFLRSVIKPEAGRTTSRAEPAARLQPAPPFEVPLPAGGKAPRRRVRREAAPVPAA